jgi:hypothetical protein
VPFHLTEQDFAFYDIGIQDWIVEDGSTFEIQVGASSRDIQLLETVTFLSGSTSNSLARESYPLQKGQAVGESRTAVDDETFAKRFGMEKDTVLDGVRQRRLKHEHHKPNNSVVHRNSLLKEVRNASMLGMILHWVVFRIGCKEIQPGPSQRREIRMVEENVANLPLRTMVLFSKGMMSFPALDILIVALIGLALYQVVYICLKVLVGWTVSKLSL